MLRLPIVRPDALRLPSLAGTIHTRVLRSLRRHGQRRKAGGLCFSRRYPRGDSFRMETTGPLKFLGNPCVRAPFSDPGGTFTPGRYGVSMRPSAFGTASAPAIRFFRGSMARPAHPLSTLRSVDYSTTTQDSLPAVGHTLPDRILPPAGFQRKVSTMSHNIASPFPKLFLTQTKRSHLPLSRQMLQASNERFQPCLTTSHPPFPSFS